MIYKATFTVVAMVEADSAGEADRRFNADLQTILENMDNGDMIGTYGLPNVVEVPADQVKTELLEVGNDGTFFNSGDDEDEQEDVS